MFSTLFVAGLYLFFSASTLDSQHMFGDFAAYVAQAKSIATGSMPEYLAANRFMMSNSVPKGPFAYPWGFPLLLAPIYAIFGFNLLAFKIANVFLMLVFLFLLGRFAEEKLGKLTPIFLLGIALHPAVLRYQNAVQSDIPFMCVSLISLLYFSRTLNKWPAFTQSRQKKVALIASLAMLPITFRLNGIVVPLAMLCAIGAKIAHHRLIKKQALTLSHLLREGKSLLLGLLIFLLLAWTWTQIFPGPGELPTHRGWPFSLEHISWQFYAYKDLLAKFLIVPRTLMHIAVPLTFVLVVLGAWQEKWREAVFIAFIIGTLGIYLMFDMKALIRYLLCLFPIISYFAWIGIKTAVEYLRPQLGKTAQVLWLLPCLVVLYQASPLHKEFRKPLKRRYLATTPEAKEMFSFIKSQPPKDAVIASLKPRAIYLYADRLSIDPLSPTDLSKVDYLVSGNLNPSRLPKQHPRFTAEFKNKHFTVYRITKLD